MGRQSAIYCDGCFRQGPATKVKRSGWAALEREARGLGWLVRVTVSAAIYLCPNCRPTAPEGSS